MARPNNPDYELFESGILARLSNMDSGYGPAIVLRGIDFEARAGEVALITGPAAAGKTTLQHVLRLALTPHVGRAVIMGVDVGRARATTRAHVKRRIGYVAENPTFIEQWTAFDNIAMPLRMTGKKPREYVEDVRREYAHVPDGQWRIGRAEVLKSLIGHRAIFPAEALRAELEDQARHNIADELSSLGAS